MTFAVHSPGLFNQFVSWDDNEYVINCLEVQAFTWNNLRFFLTTPYFGNYHPITSFTFMLDHALWGLEPIGWHLTNILLHCLNAVWVYLLARALFQRPAGLSEDSRSASSPGLLVLGAMSAALIFALHPLRVEVAAWISARKDLVCSAFFLPALLLWLHYTRRKGGPSRCRPYVGCLVLFFLALLSKPMAITLPLVLLLLDYLERRPAGPGLLFEKIPFFALSAMAAALTLWTQGEAGAIRQDLNHDWWIKAQTVTFGFVFYLGQWIWPVSLSPLYAYAAPPHPPLPPAASYAPVLFVTLLALAATCARRSRLWAFAWGMYMVMLIPVVQLIPIGKAYAADRYTYLPMVGLSVALGAMVRWVVLRQGLRSAAAILTLTFTAALLVLWSFKTQNYTRAWRTTNTLWTHAIRHTPGSDVHAFLGSDLVMAFQTHKALAQVDLSLKLNPRNYIAFSTRGSALLTLGDTTGALQAFRTAVEIEPDFASGHNNIGHALIGLERYDEAIAALDRAHRANPRLAPALFNRALARERLGQAEPAMADLDAAEKLDPHLQDIPIVRARILLRMNQVEDARGVLQSLRKAGKSIPKDLQAILEEPSPAKP